MSDTDNKGAGMSPTPSPSKVFEETVRSLQTFTFGQAMTLITEGNVVARQGWDNDDEVFIQAGFVHIKNSTGVHRMIISDGDIVATDWFIKKAYDNEEDEE